jgi:hypothetical protein
LVWAEASAPDRVDDDALTMDRTLTYVRCVRIHDFVVLFDPKLIAWKMGSELGAFCRRGGIHEATLEEWD